MTEREYYNGLPSDKPLPPETCAYCERELDEDEEFEKEWSGNAEEAEYCLVCPTCANRHADAYDRHYQAGYNYAAGYPD